MPRQRRHTAGKHQNAEDDREHFERDDFEPVAIALWAGPERQRQEKRREKNIAHRVAQPPRAPKHGEAAPALKPSRAERDSADRRGDSRAGQRPEDDERRHLTQSIERAIDLGEFAQQPCADDRFERVADGDAHGGEKRSVVGEVGDEGAHPDRRPRPPAEHEHRPERQARGWPCRAYLFDDESCTKSELRRCHVPPR